MGLHQVNGFEINPVQYVHPTFLYESLWNLLGFILINMFYKNKEYKQSDHKYKDRHLIYNVIEIDKRLINPYKKYLIIDDIFTSGSTIKTIINLLVKNKVKKENIKVIIIGKTADNVEL